MTCAAWDLLGGHGPVVATAIHHGHALRPELAGLLALPEADRLREEDPYTAAFTAVGDRRVVVHSSRFECDLNRPRETCVYRTPEQAWGLQVWARVPDEGTLDASRRLHDAFYEDLETLLRETAARHGGFLLLDMHSYNHRRAGPDAPPDDPSDNPEVNVGTGSLDRERWGSVSASLLDDLGSRSIGGRRLDVRENVKFRGGHLSRWVNATFPGVGCALALEFKKTFMDEWTGQLDTDRLDALVAALRATVAQVRGVLEACL